MKRFVIIFVLSFMMAGCTPAQMQSMKIHSSYKQAGAELKTCITNVYHNPDYESVVPHLASPENGGQPTMAQLEDETRPTKQQSRLLIKYHDDLMPCRQAFIQKVQNVTPTVAQIFLEEWVKSDQIMIKLSKHKITWGDAARQKQEAALAAQNRIIAAAQQIDSALAASHHAQLAEWREQQAVDAQTTQARAAIIQATTPPSMPLQLPQYNRTTTNCRMIGNTLNCNSY